MDIVIVIVVLVVAAAVVLAPLRRGAAAEQEVVERERRADLEARRESKYREIREAELDHRTGKLSEADWKSLDRELRGQAIAILRELDSLP